MDQAQQQIEPSGTAFSADDVIEAQPSNYDVMQLDLEQINAVFQHVQPFLEMVYERFPDEFNEDLLASEIAADRLQFWVVTNGEIVSAILGTSLDFVGTGGKVATIRFIVGKHSEKWLHLLEKVEAWAAFEGCTKVRMFARKGWAKRLPDYRMPFVVMEKEI